MSTFSSVKADFPNFQKYFHHDSARDCIKHMFKDDKTGEIVINFLSEAVKNADWRKENLTKRLVFRGFKNLKAKKEANDVSKKVAEKYSEIKRKFDVTRPKKTAESKVVAMAAKKLEVSLSPTQVEQKQQEILKQQKLQELQKQQELQKRADQEKKDAEFARLFEANPIPSKEKEDLHNFVPPTDPVVAKNCISQHFYEAMLKTKKILIDQKLYTAEEIAEIMEESYHAMLDLSLLHLLKTTKTRQKLLILTSLGLDFSLHKSLSALEAKFVLLSTKQWITLAQLATHKNAEAAKNEKDPLIKAILSLIGEVRIEIEQNVLNLASITNNNNYNFNDVFK